ncbi:MAG TPA: di-heme oxidoredictase family protein [Gammaproteobacteria bacterium]|nr:di-heme oxidoredictase family protein [Gammaproteobacteria bacterium]
MKSPHCPRATSPFSMRLAAILPLLLLGVAAHGQLVDNTQATSVANTGINKSLAEEIGAGRGDVMTPNSAVYNIERDPFRAVRRGRQLFQRKFTGAQGQGPNDHDGSGDLDTNAALGAGLADSCALCHGRPRGAAGVGGSVATRPDGRDSSHLFGLGLREMLADEITGDLRRARAAAVQAAERYHRSVSVALQSKGIHYGSITARADGSVDASRLDGVDPDLRVKPFFSEGSAFSIRQFIVGALHNEMGLEDSTDPSIRAASEGRRVVTPAGMVLDGSLDALAPPPDPDVADGDEIDPAVVDYLEFYLLNYFRPAELPETNAVRLGRKVFAKIGCASCHVPDLPLLHDRRVGDVDTAYDAERGVFNRLFSTVTPLYVEKDDGSGFPPLKQPANGKFLVHDIFTDFKRHDVGPMFYERNYDGGLQKEFMTRPLWGTGSTGPWGHDGRSITLDDVILRHGGEAQKSRDAYAQLPEPLSSALQAFLSSLVLFPPEDTASTLDPADPGAPDFPQQGHGSIKLTKLFNDPSDPE